MKLPDRQTAEGVLYTDQYQLMMAQVYFRNGLHEQHVQFDHFYSSNPNYGTHQAGYCAAAGLEWLLIRFFSSWFWAIQRFQEERLRNEKHHNQWQSDHHRACHQQRPIGRVKLF